MADVPHPDIQEFERRYGHLGGVERRLVNLGDVETRDTGEGGYSTSGYASVYDSRSLDLGGFTEEIAPGAFDDVLSRKPDVHLLWDHDTRLVLARTSNNTLKLGSDAIGLPYWGRVAPTSYAADLRVLLDRGDIDQASFAFTVGDQEWDVRDDHGAEQVMRRITRVQDLYDVTITAQGAYPAATSSAARMFVRSYAGVKPPEDLAEAIERSNSRLKVTRSRARARAKASGLEVRAVWSSAFINNLPDSSFLYIEDGGKKDDGGKTTPRSLRHFPVKDANGKVDLPHLRNALSRIPQSSLPADVKASCTKKAQALLKAAS